jgi:hypothetical protein
MAFNDIYRLRVYQRMHTAQVVNVMHFVCNDPAPVDQSATLASDFMTNMRPTLIARCTNQTAFDFVEVQKLVPFEGGPATSNFPTSTVGTVTGSCASATLCEVMTIYSERAGRRGRGRIYLPGSDTFVSSPGVGTWNATQTTRTQAFANALTARYITPVGGQFSLGVWSRAVAGPTPPWSTSAFARATGCVVRNVIRNQRRRQLGVGR